jgi:hypothetical protein
MVNFNEVVDRAKKHLNLKANKEFAEILGLSAPDFSKRKNSGTLLPLIIDWAIAENVNIDWLLTGKGSPLNDCLNTGSDFTAKQTDPPVSSNVVEMQHMQVVKGFQDKRQAKEINEALVELEEMRPEALAKVKDYIMGMVEGVRLVAGDKNHPGRDGPDKFADTDRRSGSDRRASGTKD